MGCAVHSLHGREVFLVKGIPEIPSSKRAILSRLLIVDQRACLKLLKWYSSTAIQMVDVRAFSSREGRRVGHRYQASAYVESRV